MEAVGLKPSPDEARAKIAQNTAWYHTIEVAPGVTTPGQVDLRSSARKLLPADLHGKRALDVGTFDGFWAFELERRGAETVAVDVEAIDAAQWPPLNRERLERRAREWNVELGRGFKIAAEALGSSAKRVVCDVYDLEPDRIGGAVDVAFAGAIMLHLRDPVRALEAILGVLKPGGTLIQMEPFSIRNTLLHPRRPTGDFQPLRSDFNWWLPNLSLLRSWPWTAGFVDVRTTALLRPPSTRRMTMLYVGVSARKP
jgi:SAM-dependent methyltransferase